MAEQKKDAGQQKRKAATKGAESAEKQTAAKQEAGQKSAAKPRKPAAKKEPAKKAPAKRPAARKPAAKKEPAKKPAAKPKAAPKSKEAPERPVVNASARFVRVAPRKARLIADQVRGLPIDDARALLRFSSRGAARDIRKLIES